MSIAQLKNPNLKIIALLGIASTLLIANINAEADKKEPSKKTDPLKALLIIGAGGGWHDYETQKILLSDGLEERANIKVTIAYQERSKRGQEIHSAYTKPQKEKYDVIIHNTCCHRAPATKDFIANILKTHQEGTPAVIIHCSMHLFRDVAKESGWEEFMGVETKKHGPRAAITMKNTAPNHPIMKKFPPEWTTPEGELYLIDKVFKDTTVLAEGSRIEGDKTPEPCVWAHTFRGTRVFGTTVGHHNSTVSEPNYLDLVARGLLWSCDKLDANGNPIAGYEPQP